MEGCSTIVVKGQIVAQVGTNPCSRDVAELWNVLAKSQCSRPIYCIVSVCASALCPAIPYTPYFATDNDAHASTDLNTRRPDLRLEHRRLHKRQIHQPSFHLRRHHLSRLTPRSTIAVKPPISSTLGPKSKVQSPKGVPKYSEYGTTCTSRLYTTAYMSPQHEGVFVILKKGK
jgi:hypothetical protein